jgi:hypothetical protein
MSDKDHGFAERAKETAEADVASVEVGDTPTDVESKLMGLTHVGGVPSHDAEDSEEANDEDAQ